MKAYESITITSALFQNLGPEMEISHHTNAKSLRTECPCLFTGIMRGFGVGNTAVAALECKDFVVDPLRSHIQISPKIRKYPVV